MERSKKVIFISHCILNQNSVVPPLARSKGPYRDVVEEIIDFGIGIHQLPCPEYRHLGLSRKPMDKSEYDTEEYRKLCTQIAKDTVDIMVEYLDNGYEILGIIGINSSPTCSVKGNQGILIEELLNLMKESEINVKLSDIPTYYYDGEKGREFIKKLKMFLLV